MPIDADGLLHGVRYLPSPNCDKRPDGSRVELLVIHAISLPPGHFGGDAVIGLFTNRLDHDAHPYFAGLRGLKVSAHFFVRRGGEVIQFVPCGMRAWHAGVSNWRGRDNCNDFSIGVELEGTDAETFTDDQYRALATLTIELQRAYSIRDIAGHSDVAPGRKTDPGPRFDWVRYRKLIS